MLPPPPPPHLSSMSAASSSRIKRTETRSRNAKADTLLADPGHPGSRASLVLLVSIPRRRGRARWLGGMRKVRWVAGVCCLYLRSVCASFGVLRMVVGVLACCARSSRGRSELSLWRSGGGDPCAPRASGRPTAHATGPSIFFVKPSPIVWYGKASDEHTLPR